MAGADALPSGLDIARRGQELKVMHLGLMLCLAPLLDPSRPLLEWYLSRLGAPPDGDIPIDIRHGTEESGVSYSMREVLSKAPLLRGDVVGKDLLSISMLLGGMRLGDMIYQGNHSRTDEPLLQFARHFRNACAHGDRWHFTKGEPKYAAACRDLVLTAELHGLRATYLTVSPRRYVEYLDDLSNFFAPGMVTPS